MISAVTPKSASLIALAIELKVADSTVRDCVFPFTVISTVVGSPPLRVVVSELNPAEILRCSLAKEVTSMLLVPARALVVAVALTAFAALF